MGVVAEPTFHNYLKAILNCFPHCVQSMQFNSTHFSESVWIGLDDDWESVPEKFRSHITEQQKAILFHHNQEFQQRADDCKLLVGIIEVFADTVWTDE